MKQWWRLGAPLVAAVCIGVPGEPGAPVLSFDAAAQSVRAAGLERRLLAALAARMPAAPGLGSAFAVYLGDAQVPMLGDYRVESDALRFTPRLPLLPGRAYRAALDLRRLYELGGVPSRRPDSPVLRLAFALAAPAPPAARTRVTAVFPSADVVPAHLLRIYVQFSRPMARRGIARHVRLLDDGGDEVPRAFLEMPDGLWDPAGRRLTLFLHPGRIKRGVGLHEALGLPLRPGRRYRLVVAREAEDAAGMQLAEPFVKELRVAAPDRSAPDVHRWRLLAPPPGTRQALTVAADKALDQPVFGRMLRLLDAAGRPVAGRASVEAGEARWRFAPGEPWREGDYVLRVGGELEDLAGNRPTRLFDQPAAPGGRRREARDVEVKLRIGGPAATRPARPDA
jgi:hypothetical protein